MWALVTWWQSCKLYVGYVVLCYTTVIPSRKFGYLLQCSAVDIQTHSFIIQTVSASLPAVGQYYPMLTHFWLYICRQWKGWIHDCSLKSLIILDSPWNLTHDFRKRFPCPDTATFKAFWLVWKKGAALIEYHFYKILCHSNCWIIKTQY